MKLSNNLRIIDYRINTGREICICDGDKNIMYPGGNLFSISNINIKNKLYSNGPELLLNYRIINKNLQNILLSLNSNERQKVLLVFNILLNNLENKKYFILL